MTRTLRIGTRGSQLALVQAHWVADAAGRARRPDRDHDHPHRGRRPPRRHRVGRGRLRGPDRRRRCSTATWTSRSTRAKDVPTDEHPQLVIAAYPPREDPRDALVCRERGTTLATLPHGARVGTDSPRRVGVPAGRPPGPRHPPAPRQRRHAPREAGPRRLRRARPRRRGADAPRARGPDRRDPAHRDCVASAPGQGSLALQVRARRRRGHRGRRPARRPGDARRGPGRACAAQRDRRRLPVAHRRPRPAAHGRTPRGGRRGGAHLVAARARAARRRRRPDRVGPRRRGPGREPRAGRAAGGPDRDPPRAAPRARRAGPTRRRGPAPARSTPHGIDAVNVPAIEIVPATPGADLDAAVRDVAPGDRIVDHQRQRAPGRRSPRSAASPSRADVPSWAAVGDGSLAVLAAAGVDDAFVPAVADAATLAARAPGRRRRAGSSCRAATSPTPALPATLREPRRRGHGGRRVPHDRGARRLPAAPGRGARRRPGGRASSSPAARRRAALLALAADDDARAALLAAPVIAIGEPSARPPREAGFARIVVAPSPDPSTLAAFAASRSAPPGARRACTPPAAGPRTASVLEPATGGAR